MIVKYKKKIEDSYIEAIVSKIYYGISIKEAVYSKLKYSVMPFDDIKILDIILKPIIESKINQLKIDISDYTNIRKDTILDITFKELFEEATEYIATKFSYSSDEFYSIICNHEKNKIDYFEINYYNKNSDICYTLKTLVNIKKDEKQNTYEFYDNKIKYEVISGYFTNLDNQILAKEEYDINDSIFNLNPFPLDKLLHFTNQINIKTTEKMAEALKSMEEPSNIKS